MSVLLSNNVFSLSSAHPNELHFVIYELLSSFRPIVFVLRIFGVDLGAASSVGGQMKAMLTNIYALMWLIFNVGINVYVRFISLAFFFYEFTASYNLVLDVSFTISAIGSHLILLFFIRPRFATVMQSFRLVEHQLNDHHLFIKVRRFAIASVTLTLLLVVPLIAF